MGRLTTSENLEKVLKCLPEPVNVKVHLFGDYDWPNIDLSNISSQAEEVISGAELREEPKLEPYSCLLKNPSKSLILEIYRCQEEREKKLDSCSGEEKLEIVQKKALIFSSAYFTGENYEVTLTPWDIKIHYEGQEPDIISNIRKEMPEVLFKVEMAATLVKDPKLVIM